MHLYFAPKVSPRARALTIRHSVLLAITALAAVIPATLRAEVNPPAAPLPSVTGKIRSWVDKGYYKGASLWIAKNGHVVTEEYFGDARPDSIVYLASAGKWLAAATIAAIVDEGKLSWDDPASKYIPKLGDIKGRATLRQLLSHTSGYPPYQPDGNPVDAYQTLSESVEHIIPLPPTHAPGAQFEYGGLAMQVAGRMAEIATGKDWETLFQEKIAQPLGMQNTHFTPVDTKQGGHAPMLAGGARGTLHDYARFLEMIANDGEFRGKRVLSQDSIREMQADQMHGAHVNVESEFVFRARGNRHNGVYGLGEWREELDSNGNADLISSPSWAGTYPWIDKKTGTYGLVLAHVDVAGPASKDKFSSFYSSPVILDLVRAELAKSAQPSKK